MLVLPNLCTTLLVQQESERKAATRACRRAVKALTDLSKYGDLTITLTAADLEKIKEHIDENGGVKLNFILE